MSGPTLSVIVLNYNGRQWLGPCFDAIAAQRGAPAFEIILVDNASSDGSADFVRAHYPSARIVETGGNLGFAAGNNRGAQVARSAMLVFLNNDTVPQPDWLARLHRARIDQPGCSIVASRIVFLDDPSRIDSAGDGYLLAGGAYKRGHGEASSSFEEPREVFGACGAAFLIDRGLFERLGGFDESYFMVYEDVDLSYRARLAGHACWYAADAVVEHAGSSTLGRLSEMAVFYGQRNLEWVWVKNAPGGLLVRSLPAHLAYSVAGVLYYASRGRLGPALRGKFSAVAGLPAVLRARRRVQREAVSTEVLRLMDRGWLGLKRRQKRGAGTDPLSAE